MTATTTRKPDPLAKPATAIGCLIGLTVLFAAFGPKAEIERPRDNATVEASRALGFEDLPGGVVVVKDQTNGQEIARFGIGEGGFVRTTMRSLARERMERRIPRDPPFMLERLSNNALLLSDPQTGTTVRLAAFGATNAASFGAFLEDGSTTQ